MGISQPVYRQTTAIMRGEEKLSPLFVSLQQYIKEQFGVYAPNFVLNHKTSYDQLRPTLAVLVLGGKEAAAFYYNADGNYSKRKMRLIVGEFLRLEAIYQLCPGESMEDLFVKVVDFEQEIREQTVAKAAEKAIPALLANYKDREIWQITCLFGRLFVLFRKEAQVEKCQIDGTCQRMIADFCAAVEAEDDFHLVPAHAELVQFDSKEVVDRDYKGNLYYYFR